MQIYLGIIQFFFFNFIQPHKRLIVRCRGIPYLSYHYFLKSIGHRGQKDFVQSCLNDFCSQKSQRRVQSGMKGLPQRPSMHQRKIIFVPDHQGEKIDFKNIQIIPNSKNDKDSSFSNPESIISEQIIQIFRNGKKINQACPGCSSTWIIQNQNNLSSNFFPLYLNEEGLFVSYHSYQKEILQRYATCALNQGGATLILGIVASDSDKAELNQEDAEMYREYETEHGEGVQFAMGFSFYPKQEEDQKRILSGEIKALIQQSIYPKTFEMQIRFIPIVRKGERDTEKINYLVSINLWPKDCSVFYYTKSRKKLDKKQKNKQINQQIRIWLWNQQTKQPSIPKFSKSDDKIPKGKTIYKALLSLYQRCKFPFYKICDNFICKEGTSYRQNIIKEIQKQDKIISDLQPDHPFQYGFVIVFGSIKKLEYLEKAKLAFDVRKIRYVFSKPFQKYRLNSQKVMIFLSCNADFQTISSVLKEDDYENVFHSIIVVNDCLKVTARFQQDDIAIKQMENLLECRYPKARRFKIENKNDEIAYQFCSIVHCFFCFCVLENQGLKSLLIRKSVFDTLAKEWQAKKHYH